MEKRLGKKRISGQVISRKSRKRKLSKKVTSRFTKRRRVLSRRMRTSVHPVGAVIITSNTEASIVNVLEPLKRLPLREIIVIVHGSADGTLEMVKRHSRAILIHIPVRMERDAARALAARISRSDFLLFIEEDKIVNAEELLPSIRNLAMGIENGTLVRRHELAINEHHYSYV